MATPTPTPKTNAPSTKATIPISSSVKSRDLTQPILFSQGNVKQFRDSDFTLDSRESVCLKYDDCVPILFYGSNEESLNLVKIWADAAAQTPGFIFGAVHLELEKNIAKNFASLNTDPNHPYYWAALRQVPFILVYRRGWPSAFYNGQRATQPIIDYVMTLACRADYHEHEQNYYSLQAVSNIEMTGVNKFETQKYGSITIPPRTSSSNFKTSQPMRGYNNTIDTRYVTSNSIESGYINNTYADTNIKESSKPPVAGTTTGVPKTAPTQVNTAAGPAPAPPKNTTGGSIAAPVQQK
jgi:hypothetical protein